LPVGLLLNMKTQTEEKIVALTWSLVVILCLYIFGAPYVSGATLSMRGEGHSDVIQVLAQIRVQGATGEERKIPIIDETYGSVTDFAIKPHFLPNGFYQLYAEVRHGAYVDYYQSGWFSVHQDDAYNLSFDSSGTTLLRNQAHFITSDETFDYTDPLGRLESVGAGSIWEMPSGTPDPTVTVPMLGEVTLPDWALVNPAMAMFFAGFATGAGIRLFRACLRWFKRADGIPAE